MKFNILLADDSADDAILLGEALRLAALEDHLKVTRNGEQVMSYLERKGAYADAQTYPFPDFLLLDVYLPLLDGFEVIKAIRANPRFKSLPIHVWSGKTRQVDVDRAYALGATSYLVKPGTLLGLQELILRLHRMHEATSQPKNPQ